MATISCNHRGRRAADSATDDINKVIDGQNARITELAQPNISNLPTLADIEKEIRELKATTFGPDLVPPAVFKLELVLAARIIHPLALKCASLAQSAFWLSGGMYAELFKGKGTAAERKTYRAILLADPLAKVIRKPVRRKLQPQIDHLLHATQLGGHAISPTILCAFFRRVVEGKALHTAACS